jgi:serine protease Do
MRATSTTLPAPVRSWLAVLRTTGADGKVESSLAVAVRTDGYLLAPASSVTGKSSIEVTFPNRTSMLARVTGIDSDTGSAVLQLDAHDLAVAPIGSALGLTSQSAMAAVDQFGGHPASLTRLICEGKNDDGSALKRQLCVHTTTEVGGAVLQNDQVVGLVTAPDADDDAMMAVPIDIALASADSIIRTGAVHRPWFGIAWSSDLRIIKVDPESPAAKAGLAVDDRVIAVGYHPLDSSGQLMMCVWSKLADTPSVFTVERNGSRLDMQVTPRDSP